MTSERSGDVFFACDVGNSRAAFSLVAGGRIRQVVRVPLAGLEGLAAALRLDPSAAETALAAPLVVTSVNPAATERLKAVAAAITSGPLLLARRDFAIAMEALVERPEAVGVDRLLAALAAREQVGRPVIVVDVGTAATVDAVDAEGRFIGGSILPGPSLGAWSLHQRTAALPEVDLSAPPAPQAIGRDTVSAIRGGILLGMAGAVERLVAEQQAVLGGRAKVVGTGGGLALIADRLRCLDHVRPDLVLEGLVSAYLASR